MRVRISAQAGMVCTAAVRSAYSTTPIGMSTVSGVTTLWSLV